MGFGGRFTPLWPCELGPSREMQLDDGQVGLRMGARGPGLRTNSRGRLSPAPKAVNRHHGAHQAQFRHRCNNVNTADWLNQDGAFGNMGVKEVGESWLKGLNPKRP